MSSGKPVPGAAPDNRRADLLAVLSLFGLAFLLLSRQIILGGSTYDEDMRLMSLPVYSWYAESLRQGQIPIWSSGVMGGYPLAFAIYGFFYPPDMLLYRFLDGARAFHLSLALHVGLAGACTYWYCRVLGMRRLPSMVAAVAFQMGNQILMWQSNGYITKTLFVLPGLLATVELMFRRGIRYWLLVPVLVGAALLVGYSQVLLYSLAATAIYAVIGLACLRHTIEIRRWIPFMGSLGFGVALGFGLGAVRVGPTLAMVGQSTRAGGMDIARSAVDSIEPLGLLLGHLLPAVFEIPGSSANKPDFVGMPVLILALLAVAAFQRLGRAGWFHVGLAVVASLLSLGVYTPFYGWLLSIPFFSLFRGPDRFSWMAGFALSILAAHALNERLPRDLAGQKGRYRAVAAVAIAAIAASIAGGLLSLAFQFGHDPFSESIRAIANESGWHVLNLLRPTVAVVVLGLILGPLLVLLYARRRISGRLAEGATLALTALILFTLGLSQNPWQTEEALYRQPVFLKELRADTSLYRIFSWAPGMSTFNVRSYYQKFMGVTPSREFDEYYFRQFIPPNLGMFFALTTADWYDALQTRRQALVSRYLGSSRAETGQYAQDGWIDPKIQNVGMQDRLDFMAAMNVRYLTHGYLVQDPRLELVDQVDMKVSPQIDAVASVYLYRLKNAMPRAFVVPEAVVIEREKTVLDSMLAGSIDLKQKVILEQPTAPLSRPALTSQGSQVDVQEYRDGQVIVRTRTDGSGYLVLMDFLLPGWSVKVDGVSQPMQAGNFAGRAVAIDRAGDHLVEFDYQAPLLREGIAVSVASLVVLLLAFGWNWRRSRR